MRRIVCGRSHRICSAGSVLVAVSLHLLRSGGSLSRRPDVLAAVRGPPLPEGDPGARVRRTPFRHRPGRPPRWARPGAARRRLDPGPQRDGLPPQRRPTPRGGGWDGQPPQCRPVLRGGRGGRAGRPRAQVRRAAPAGRDRGPAQGPAHARALEPGLHRARSRQLAEVHHAATSRAARSPQPSTGWRRSPGSASRSRNAGRSAASPRPATP